MTTTTATPVQLCPKCFTEQRSAATCTCCGLDLTTADMITQTGRADDLGRPILVDRYGRREWRASDYDRPPHLAHLTADQWYRMRQHHGPVTCG